MTREVNGDSSFAQKVQTDTTRVRSDKRKVKEYQIVTFVLQPFLHFLRTSPFADSSD